MNENKTAILFIHGFMCGRRFFDTMIDALDGCGADLISFSLAGHDSTFEDFRRTGCDQWQESADVKLAELQERYDRILLVGHSMGGLIALRAAVARPEKIIGVVGIGFPIKISLGPDWIKLNAAASKPAVTGEDPRVTAARDMAGVTIRGGFGEYLKTMPQNMSFLREARQARREISQLKAPLTVINFEKDEIVSKSVPDFVRKKLPDAKILVLPESYHFLFAKEEFKKMLEIIREYIG